VIFAAMHGLMQIRNGRYEHCESRNPEGRQPMFHAVMEVNEPLAGDAIAKKNKGDGAGIDYKGSKVVHIGESV
jgi:hypothetical protein